jgi:hypothetical protein
MEEGGRMEEKGKKEVGKERERKRHIRPKREH